MFCKHPNYEKYVTVILFWILPSQKLDAPILWRQKFPSKFLISASVSTMQQYIVNNFSKTKH